ncbi:MAG TPA: plastocyanin/azurin family copper-binding protein [Ktedonobacteraceae bacterium]|nr:plastocyanin/azurin family copper-binding protein [Ktedonobacteraceae bacterium]
MVKRWLFLLALSALLTLILMACGSTTTSNNTSGGPNEVHTQGVTFVQSSITIAKGSSLTLVDDDNIPHIITNGTWVNGTAKPAKELHAPEARNVQINGNAQATIGPFTSAGTFKFYCTIHPGMNLTVIVQ